MNVGIVCYASVGGSGVVATELARCLANRGHSTHVISSDTPFRLRESDSGVTFHRVTPGYPLFREPQYLLALANRIVQVSREHRLDIIHAHYAIPHAAAAYLARQILAGSHAGSGIVPATITALHGSDVTILGSDPVPGNGRVLYRSVRCRHCGVDKYVTRPSERCQSTARSTSFRISRLQVSSRARNQRCAGGFACQTKNW